MPGETGPGLFPQIQYFWPKDSLKKAHQSTWTSCSHLHSHWEAQRSSRGIRHPWKISRTGWIQNRAIRYSALCFEWMHPYWIWYTLEVNRHWQAAVWQWSQHTRVNSRTSNISCQVCLNCACRSQDGKTTQTWCTHFQWQHPPMVDILGAVLSHPTWSLDLTKPQKRAYLRQALKHGSARNMIESLSRTGERYDEAIECLENRYNKPRLIHQAHVKEIIEVPNLRDNSAKEIRQLHGVLQQHLRALKSMRKEPTSPFITSLIEMKLDNDKVRVVET